MKMIQRAIGSVALAVAAMTAAPAMAVTVGTIPDGADNDFINLFLGGQKVEGLYDADLFLTGQSDILVEYFGAEAGFLNEFDFTGTPNCSFAHAGGNTFSGTAPLDATDRIGSCTVNNVAAGLLPFSFLINGTTLLANGANNANVGVLPNFFVSFDNNYLLDTILDGSTPFGGQSVFLFLDDAGAGPDDNHDDMVIRLSIANGGGFKVPEPGTLALAGLALLGLGASRRFAARK